jgi:MoxR-like ATPase
MADELKEFDAYQRDLSRRWRLDPAARAELEQRRAEQRAKAYALINGVDQFVVGLTPVVTRVVMGLLSDGQVKPGKAVSGHILLEAVPGTAKTLISETLARLVDLKFSRIQMDADKRPSDIIGFYEQQDGTGKLEFTMGPIFANVVLIDEVNRARPEVKGALLQAMAEREVTVDNVTHQLEEPFFVLANQNPIEQEGTFPLVEAELDRLIAKIRLDYISRDEEIDMVRRVGDFTHRSVTRVPGLDRERLVAMRTFIREWTYVDSRIMAYAVDLVRATRPDEPRHRACLHDLIVDGRSVIRVGAGPRASVFLVNFAKTAAFLSGGEKGGGRDHVRPADVRGVAFDVLNHRLIVDDIVESMIVGKRPVPFLDERLLADGERVPRNRHELLVQAIRRILRGVPVP